MKADMVVLKDQMASKMEAMLSMERLIESNATTATAAKADTTHPSTTNQAHQPARTWGDEEERYWGAPTARIWGITEIPIPTAYPPISHYPPCMRTWIMPFP